MTNNRNPNDQNQPNRDKARQDQKQGLPHKDIPFEKDNERARNPQGGKVKE